MYPLLRAMDVVMSWLCITIMGILTCLVILAVVLRYLFDISIIQMEETICVLFVATTLLGTALAVREKSHVLIPSFTEFLAPHAQRVFHILSMCAVIVVSATILWTSVQWIARIGGTNSLSLQIPCGYYYVLVPISFALIIVYSIVDIASQFVPIPEADKGYVADSELADVGDAEVKGPITRCQDEGSVR